MLTRQLHRQQCFRGINWWARVELNHHSLIDNARDLQSPELTTCSTHPLFCYLAEVVGIEPTRRGIKTRSLSTWLHLYNSIWRLYPELNWGLGVCNPSHYHCAIESFVWQARRDLNSHHASLESAVLPIGTTGL